MIKLLTEKHYAPAETRIPLSAFAAALAHGTSRFDEKLRACVGAGHCVLGSSARALLAGLLVKLWEESRGLRDEVLVPAYTCYSVAASVAAAGLKIAVYDIDPDTFQPDLASLKEQAGERTLAVVVQHLFGIPSRMGDIAWIARREGFAVIDDAAQALGGTLDNQALGTMGDYGLYSFGRGKPLPLGSGGAMVAREARIIDTLRPGLKETGYLPFVMAALVQALSHPRIYGILEALPLGLGETAFDPDIELSSMGAMAQALGCHAVRSLEKLNAHRNAIARIYGENVFEGLQVSVPEGVSPVYTRFPVLAGQGPITPEMKRLGVRRMYPSAIVDEPAIRPHLVRPHTGAPGARAIAEALVTLPTHLGITEPVAREIASLVNRSALGGTRKA